MCFVHFFSICGIWGLIFSGFQKLSVIAYKYFSKLRAWFLWFLFCHSSMKNESTFSGSFIVVFPIIDGWHNELTLFSSLSIHDYGKSLQIFIWFDLLIFNQWGSGRLVADRYLKVLVLGHFHFFGLPKTLYTCTLNKACLCSTQRKISVNLSQQRLSDKKLSPF